MVKVILLAVLRARPDLEAIHLKYYPSLPGLVPLCRLHSLVLHHYKMFDRNRIQYRTGILYGANIIDYNYIKLQAYCSVSAQVMVAELWF